MNNLDSRIAIIKQKIERIRQALENSEQSTITLRRKINFQLNTSITIKELVEIENYYEITFPPEYRAFITNIANGGSGPNSGLLSLQDSLIYSYAVKQQKRLDKEFLKTPFTYSSKYNPNEDTYILELGEKCDRGEIPQSECDKVYDYLIAGTMTISLEGCGYCRFLVITGATRGQVWFNADAGDGGYIPLNLSFLDWYEEWLDEIVIGNFN